MLKTTLVAAALLTASGVAHAGGQEGSIGVGAEFMITPITPFALGGASLTYDAGAFHVGGFLGFEDGDGPDNTDFTIGGRFYYHVHSTAMSDFGIGGSLGIVSLDAPMGADRQTGLFIDPGAQIRLFLAANVAISAQVGVSIGTMDASGVAITGQTIGGGIHYYFF
ncbi:MAG TPA: hypothetical protein VFV99_19520 [Kofleriaceae bacterium]|nr:hypothetical protein [Kofleriaceae bacterium]